MSGQDSEIDRSYSLFEELLDVYELEPTLANYVRFRRTSGVSGADVARLIECIDQNFASIDRGGCRELT